MTDENLHSLSTGIVSIHGKDKVNCEEAEVIGARVQETLNDVIFSEAIIKRKDRFVALDSFTKNISNGEKDPICVNPTLLFTRLAAIAEREEDVEQYFDFELTHRPQSLFKNELMRKPDKSSLRNILLTDQATKPPDTVVGKHVVDGGALLHRVRWQKGMTFKEVAEAYVSYVHNNYRQAHVIFDGYDNPMSTKSNEHSRRLKSKGSSQNVVVKQENEAPYSKERFLSNAHNKGQLISLLSDFLTRDGQVVHICRDDSDTKIVSTALQLAKESNTIVVADDTDVAIMLLYHWKDELLDICFLQERGKKCWSIKEAVSNITLKDHLLFIHAWSGCDTTSSTLGKGEPSLMKAVQKSKAIQTASEILTDYWATEKEVGEAAVEVFVEMYGGTKDSSLRKLRYSKYCQMLSDGIIEPEKLAPSERAAYFHGLRVHLQIIEWKMLDETLNLDPASWGWKLGDDGLVPIPMDNDVAPPAILKVIRCNCKSTSKNPCGTNVCSCKKNGLKCMSA